ncbi:MAG: protein-ADP-ribose hydrolase [Lachnospiraceae bacterium]|jgi:O-acetyl-ADP-ribose deacetylase (regulator of RNase III)|nr:protein-ADP-ribose hydrolase [Lachnospiraceae bacterium]
MTQAERLTFLIEYLINENNGLESFHIPVEENARKRLLRSLMNIRPPKPATKDFLDIQGEYLQEEKTKKGVITLADIPFVKSGIYLWQGDITRLSVDAIVNAANSGMLGCFVPCHGCIDNAIHSAAGIELRLECSRIMEKQKTEEPAGRAKITKAYHLPSRYVLHTVGPIIYGEVTQRDCNLLSDCYRSCLELAAAYRLKSIAFCCISTGEFHFPNEAAAQIAIQTIKDYQKKNPGGMEVIFNVFKDCDYEIYRQLLG